jgi:hypothetical protein
LFARTDVRHSKQVVVVAFCVLLLACKRIEPIHLQPTIEEPPTMARVIRMADPSTSTQLVQGFYSLESNAWRWSGPQFSVALEAPPSARQDGATLVLAFNLPEVSIRTLKKITVTAKIGDTALSPEAYATAGAHEYRRAVPASAFTTDAIEADFALDKFLKPANDGRELGLIVKEIGLEAK